MCVWQSLTDKVNASNLNSEAFSDLTDEKHNTDSTEVSHLWCNLVFNVNLLSLVTTIY